MLKVLTPAHGVKLEVSFESRRPTGIKQGDLSVLESTVDATVLMTIVINAFNNAKAFMRIAGDIYTLSPGPIARRNSSTYVQRFRK